MEPYTLYGAIQIPQSLSGGLQTPLTLPIWSATNTTDSTTVYGGLQTPLTLYGALQKPLTLYGGQKTPLTLYGGLKMMSKWSGAHRNWSTRGNRKRSSVQWCVASGEMPHSSTTPSRGFSTFWCASRRYEETFCHSATYENFFRNGGLMFTAPYNGWTPLGGFVK